MPRHAGVSLPLFSAVSTTSWGLGELPDLAPLSRWLAAGGFDRLMLLPLGTMPEGETSPYSAMSAMAIDPIYIAIDRVEDLSRPEGAAVFPEDAVRDVQTARGGARVDYTIVRRAKIRALTMAFDRFHAEEALVLRALRDARVMIHPGHFFDFAHEAFLVMSLLPDRRVFTDALDRLLPVVAGDPR